MTRSFSAVLIVATLALAGVIVVDARTLSQAAPATKMCTSCEEFVTLGEAYLNEPKTMAAITAEVKKVCVDAGEQAPTCELMLQAGVQYAVDFINTKGTPVAACTAAGLCAAKKPASSPRSFSSPALTRAIAQGADAMYAGVAAADPPGGPDCLKCKFAVETMHTAVTSNDTVSQLLAQADALCAKYAAAFDMAPECAALIKTYGPELIKEIGEKLADPAAVCASIGMCTDNAAAAAAAADAAVEEKKEETPQLAVSEDAGAAAVVVEEEKEEEVTKKTEGGGGNFMARAGKNILRKIRVVQAMSAATFKHQNI